MCVCGCVSYLSCNCVTLSYIQLSHCVIGFSEARMTALNTTIYHCTCTVKGIFKNTVQTISIINVEHMIFCTFKKLTCALENVVENGIR